jgi:hypothetical protein
MGQLKNKGRWEEVKADEAVLPPMGPAPRRVNLPCHTVPSGRRWRSMPCESRGHRRLRRLYRTFGVLALIIGGMVLREAQVAWGTPRALRFVPPLESFLWWDSFSEVEQTTATLRAHALRAIAESRTRYLQIRRRPSLGIFPENAIVDRALADEMERLNRVIGEFAGTDQEALLVGELLHVLQKADRDDQWLDEFLNGTYRWPVHELFVWNTRRAIELGRRLNREAEVTAAIRFRGSIPAKYWPHQPPGSLNEAPDEAATTTQGEVARPWILGSGSAAGAP